MLPVDGGAVVPVPEPSCGQNCPTLSPDGTHYAQMLDEDTIQWSYPGANVGGGEDSQREIIIGGQTLLFAPNSDFALVWDNDQLNAYRFFVDMERYGMNGSRMNVAQIWSAELATGEVLSEAALQGQAAWSEDSTTAAYLDAAGIWRYDFFQQTEPQLIVSFDEDVPALDVFELSRSGRYLRYGAVDDWTLLDVQTGSTYNNGLISPDELYLGLIDSSESSVPESQRQDMAECYLPVPPDCAARITTSDGYEVTYSTWYDSDTLLVIYCHRGNRGECLSEGVNVNEMPLSLPRRPIPEGFTRYLSAYGAAYDPQYRMLALVSDDYAVQVNNADRMDSDDGLDLSDYLDSPIVSIEWGESLWYDGE